jgi:hypothetical protein
MHPVRRIAPHVAFAYMRGGANADTDAASIDAAKV